MSALPAEADMLIVGINVCFVPETDMRTPVGGFATDDFGLTPQRAILGRAGHPRCAECGLSEPV